MFFSISSFVLGRNQSKRLKHLSVHCKIFHRNMSSGKPKVFVTRSDFPEASISMLKKKFDLEIFNGTNIKKDEIINGVKNKEAIYCSLNDKIDKDVLSAGNKLKVIGTMSVGIDHIDLKSCKEKGVKVGYTPGVLTEAVSELAVALLLATSRRLFESHKEVLNGGWSSWSPMWMCGQGLHDATVGIFGLGDIGSEIARKLKAFRVCKIFYTDSRSNQSEDCESEKPSKSKTHAKELGAIRLPFDEFLKESDFVIVACGLTEETRGIFNKDKFALMKPTAIFINISRGPVVVQEDLQKALECNTIGAAGLDVMVPEPLPTDHPLLSLPNCVIIPHIGSATYKARTEMGTLTAENIIAGIEGMPIPKEYK